MYKFNLMNTKIEGFDKDKVITTLVDINGTKFEFSEWIDEEGYLINIDNSHILNYEIDKIKKIFILVKKSNYKFFHRGHLIKIVKSIRKELFDYLLNKKQY